MVDAHYSSYSQFSQTESAIASPIVSTGQPQNFPSNPPSGPSSTMVQMAPSTKAFEVPPSITAVQSQYQMMVPKAERGLIQAPVDVQAASKVAGEKRRRNATASHNSRQRGRLPRTLLNWRLKDERRKRKETTIVRKEITSETWPYAVVYPLHLGHQAQSANDMLQ